MADVARLAGVSVATVSHVLNGTRPVRPDTRDQVLAAVRQANYTPNTVARSLATARTTTIGLALSAISNPYFGDLLRAIETTAGAAGYTLLLADPREEPDYELTVVQRLQRCLLPDLDVLLPKLRSDASGEAFLVVAAANENGAEVLVKRIQEQLEHCQELQQTGFTFTISYRLLEVSNSEQDVPIEIFLRKVTLGIEGIIQSVPAANNYHV